MVQRWTKQAKRVPPALLRCTEVSPPTVELGHFRPINDICAMSAFHPIATELLHYGK
jgi:hypothetical protein